MLLYRRKKLSGEVFHETQENFAAVLATAMLLSFAGCANKDTQGDSSEPAGEQTTEERTTEPQTNEDGSLVKPKNAVSSPTM